MLSTNELITKVRIRNVKTILSNVFLTSGGGGGGVTSVSGTSNRITSTGGTTPVIDISTNYVGQNTIITLGTITAGTWSATTIAANKGGTGQTIYAIGDILAADTISTLSKITDVASGSYLRSGGLNTLPLWSTLILPNAATANRIAYATSSNTWGESAGLTFDGTNFNCTGQISGDTTASLAGLNVSGLAGNPSGISDGDFWYNTTLSMMCFGGVGSSRAIINMLAAASTTNQIPTFAAVNGRISGSANLTFVSSRIIGTTMYITLSASTTSAGTSPIKIVAGTVMTTAEAGAFEYDGTSLFFTRTGTTRESILTGIANVVSPTAPNRTIQVVVAGTILYIAAKTTND